MPPTIPSASPPRRPARRLAALLFLASLALNLAGNGRISLWDRDEPRYAQATRQMLASGDWVVPHFNDDFRFDKPILIYWLMGGAMRAFGVNEFSARLPAALAGASTVLVVFYLALAMGCAAGAALLAGAMTMTGVLMVIVAKSATTDGALTLTVVAMMSLLWRQRQRGFSWARHLAFFAVLAASVLLKGPPGLVVLASAALCEALWRRLKKPDGSCGELAATDAGKRVLRALAGLAVFFALALPWAILAWQRTGGEFFRVAIGHHVVERSLKPLESHGGSTLLFLPYYLPVALFGCFPWTAPMLVGLRHAWRHRHEPAPRFLWCWLAPAFVIFSLVSTKLPHYIAPLMPALALMAALGWQARVERPEDEPERIRQAWRVGTVLTAVAGILAAAALIAIAVILKVHALIPPLAFVALVLAGGSAWGAWHGWALRLRPALIAWGATAAAGLGLAFLWLLPAAEPLKPSKVMVTWVRQHAPAGTRLAAAEYREPTLVFYWGAVVTMLGNSEPDEALALLADRAHPTALIVPRRRWEKWQKRLPALRTIPTQVAFSRKFYIFQRGQWADLIVVTNW